MAFALSVVGTGLSDDRPNTDNRLPGDADLGVVEGVVRYVPDAERPWRYSRYYIKRLSTGALAESVVALSSPSLRRLARGEPKSAAIDQKDFRFVPETIAIRAGDQVKFTNSDVQVHNVRSYDGEDPFNVNTPVGADYSHTFERAGGIRKPIQIGCSYHSQMTAWIFVFGHPFFEVTGDKGKFRLEDVPPGEYQLEMAHPAGKLRWSQKITVKAGETLKIEIPVSPDHLVEEKP